MISGGHARQRGARERRAPRAAGSPSWLRPPTTSACGRHAVDGYSRRAFVRRSGGAALGPAAVWSAPTIRSTALALGAAGTPPPEAGRTRRRLRPNHVAATGDPADPGDGDPTDPGAAATGRLPLTGTNPVPLIIAGGAAITGGAALLCVAQDPEPTRGER